MSLRVWVEERTGKQSTSYLTRWRYPSGDGGGRYFKEQWQAYKLKTDLEAGAPPPAPNTFTKPPDPADVTWTKFMRRYWPHMQDRVKPRSLVRYKEMMARFEELAQPGPLAAFTKLDAVRYREDLSRQEVKGTGRRITRKTVNDNITAVKSAWSLAVQWELVEANPFQGMGKLKETDSRDEAVVLELDEIEAFETACPDEFRPFFAVLVRTGLRKGELLALTARDVDEKRRSLQVNNFKTSTSPRDRYRTLPLSDRIFELLVNRAGRAESGHLFSIKHHSPNWLLRHLQATAKRLVKENRLPAWKAGLRLHDLRHTYASHFLAGGGDLRSLMYLLGHRRIETTQRYIHPLGDRLAAASQVLPY